VGRFNGEIIVHVWQFIHHADGVTIHQLRPTGGEVFVPATERGLVADDVIALDRDSI